MQEIHNFSPNGFATEKFAEILNAVSGGIFPSLRILQQALIKPSSYTMKRIP
jgi:hypothetical protein